MPTNALLVRWSGGWHEVTDPASIAANGRREAMLSLGAVQSVGELERIAAKHLELFGRVRSQITADTEPIGDSDTPYWAYKPGDTITVPDADGTPVRERVVSMRVSVDQDGNLAFTPQLKDLVLEEEERFDQTIKKMTNGTFGGSAASSTPAGP